MFNAISHPSDFHLAQRCIEEDAEAMTLLPQEFGGAVIGFLRRAGATESDAHEIVEALWADCLAKQPSGSSRIAAYRGHCSLQTWLNKVALNRLLTHRRELRRRESLHLSLETADAGSAQIEETAGVEEPLLRLMREGIEKAFATCPAEDFVMLQLMHSGDLKLAELAKMFHCSMATISRQIDRAARGIAAATLAHVRKVDPWLDLQWEDFLEFCRSDTPSCFGFGD